MSNTLIWSAFADADCDSFNLYRAITGLTIAFPNSIQVGDKFVFSVGERSQQQTITMSGTTMASLISDVTTYGKGISAVANEAETAVLIRVTATHHPRFQIYPCPFATHTSQTPRVVFPRLEWTLIDNQTFNTGVFDYTYVDLDGQAPDWYHMTSVLDSVESIPTLDMKAVLTPENTCVIIGRVITPQNNAVQGAKVFVQVMPEGKFSDNSGITGAKYHVLTDLYGRFAIPLLQKQVVLLQIKSIGYNNTVWVPDQPYVLFSDLKILPPPDQDVDGIGGVEYWHRWCEDEG